MNEKKITLFVGPWRENVGPANVIRSIKECNRNDDFIFINSNNKIMQLAEVLLRIINVDAVIVSPITTLGLIALEIASKLKKRTAILLHGCVKYEQEINNSYNLKQLQTEEKGLKIADKLILVSEMYMNWYKSYYPQYSLKMEYVNNGFNLDIRPPKTKRPLTVAVMGGNTPIKRNKVICETINYLNSVNKNFHLFIFGEIAENGEHLPISENITVVGHIPHTQVLKMLDEIETFVINSDLESFSLAATDAINCRCNLLMTGTIGLISVLSHEPDVLIRNNSDIKEISYLLEELSKNGNYNEIISLIDKNKCSVQEAVEQLKIKIYS